MKKQKTLLERLRNRLKLWGNFSRGRKLGRKIVRCGSKTQVLGKIRVENRNVILGNGVKIWPGVVFWGDGQIEIGDNVLLGDNVMIFASSGGGVKIGADTLIAANSYIIDLDHGLERGKLIRETPSISEPISIGRNVWIGENATILRGSRISDNAVVGAKALVKGSVSEYSIVAGVPAKEIRKY